MRIDFPFAVDRSGRTARTTREDHLRDMLEQLLLTDPGERPNRPDYGTGLRGLLFAPLSPQVAAAVALSARAAIERWLAEELELLDLTAAAEESALFVEVTYVLRDDPDATPRRAVIRSDAP
jgi:phage baseplate assembly protein W